jgi:hypothetical protein
MSLVNPAPILIFREMRSHPFNPRTTGAISAASAQTATNAHQPASRTISLTQASLASGEALDGSGGHQQAAPERGSRRSGSAGVIQKILRPALDPRFGSDDR